MAATKVLCVALQLALLTFRVKICAAIARVTETGIVKLKYSHWAFVFNAEPLPEDMWSAEVQSCMVLSLVPEAWNGTQEK
jgi:hypothetical protein